MLIESFNTILFCYYDVFMLVFNFLLTTSISCVQCCDIFIIYLYFYYTLKCVRIILLFCYYDVFMLVLNFSSLLVFLVYSTVYSIVILLLHV